MISVVLYQPEIPPNTGNIIRLCANTGSDLHLIHPLGFDISEKSCRRAGLDYNLLANVKQHDDWNAFVASTAVNAIYALSTHATKNYTEVNYQAGDFLLMGPETRGLPSDMISQYNGIRIPMQANSRSLNLSNATAVVLYEALRQQGFNHLS